jgi:cellulose synthase/poly-beta-1,6-N-acetylglucosamine synthase-like glycosyltransferase
MAILKIAYILVIGLYALSLLLIMFYSFMQFQLLIKYFKARSLSPRTQSMRPTEFTLPRITIQLPVYNEALVIHRLIDNIVKLDYPADLLQIQVLDDSTDHTKALIREKTIFYQSKGVNIVHIHRPDRKGFKAGALQNGLATATGNLIAIFDADFLPHSDFLRQTVPYFSDQQIGVVQTRWGHINKDYSLITRLQAFQLNVHFSIEQTGREMGGYFLQFNGTAGIWRKAAIMDAGGWKDRTLTEDLDLSYRAQIKGWKIHYCQDIEVPAELPVEMIGLKSQQFRWMKGGAENARLLLPEIIKSSLSRAQKIHAVTHLLSSSVFLIVLMLAVLSVPLFFIYDQVGLNLKLFAPFIISVALLACVYYIGNRDTSWKEVSGSKRFLRLVLMFPVFLSLSMGLSYHTSRAILEGFRGKKSSFIRTPKFNIQEKGKHRNVKAYSTSGKPGSLWMEGLLTMYFLVAVGAAFILSDYSFLIYHLMLAIGFGSIFILTFHHQYRL